jgi:hypothetical protein
MKKIKRKIKKSIGYIKIQIGKVKKRLFGKICQCDDK